MRRTAVACNVLLLLLCVPAQALQIECGDVYASLQQHVRSSQAWPALDTRQACMSDAFIVKSLMHMNASTLQQSNGVFLLTEDSRALAELVTFAMIGRHFIQQEVKESFAFSWNRYHGTLTLENRMEPLAPFFPNSHTMLRTRYKGFSTRITNTLATQALSSERPLPTRQHTFTFFFFNLLHEQAINEPLLAILL